MGKDSTSKAMQVRIDVSDDVKRFELEKLEEFQGKLKDLHQEDFERLKKSILEEGFFVPIFLWNDGKKLQILDGHQRIRVLRTLRDGGYLVPKIPAVMILAKTKAQAKKRLLLITSQYGKVKGDGLYEFIQGMDEKMLVTDFALPDINPQKFLDEFFNDLEAKIDPLPPVTGNLGSVGGNGVKMLQLFYTEEQHGEVLSLIAALQPKLGTENATDTVLEALKYAHSEG